MLGCRLLAVFNLPPPQFAKKAGESVRRERRGERQMCRSFVRWFAESEKWSGVFVRPSVRRPSVNSGKCLSDMKIDNVRREKRSIGEAGQN